VLTAWGLERKLTPRWADQPPIPGDDFRPGAAAVDEDIVGEASPVSDEAVATAPHPGLLPAARGEGGTRDSGRMRGLPREEAGSSSGEDKPCDAAPSADEAKAPPRPDGQIPDPLFDEAGEPRLPPDLIFPRDHLLSTCISQALTPRSMARAWRDAGMAGQSGGG
jgi:hypothetical protein